MILVQKVLANKHELYKQLHRSSVKHKVMENHKKN